ncbi:tetratricopeptide repeat protein [Anaeromyxobacter terrae]|uniref:tetratricopeptide repeat protein n=1 Tax=Anaeromyxobacter terrae TaxID=2925406 RepID=UPI001F572F69|nr:tetratricopeptide repeat protein [Anaeromyxobacter sp. SG22]
MDVRCERCKAQYVFDDEQITPSGLAVQCTNCGHLFRVKKKELVVTVPVKPGELDSAPMPASAAAPRATGHAPAAARSEAREWRVRRPGGAVLTCRELTTVQKWIVEGKVAREDEISAGGDSWRRLGEIDELSSFFSVVAEAERARATPVETPRPPARVPPPPPSGFPPPALPFPPPEELGRSARASEAHAAEPASRPARRGARGALFVALLAVATGVGAYALNPGMVGRLTRKVLGTTAATATPPPTPTATPTPTPTPTPTADATAAAPPSATPAPAANPPSPSSPDPAHAEGQAAAGSPAPPAPEPPPSGTAAAPTPEGPSAVVVPASAEATAPLAKPSRPRGPKALLAEAGRLRARGDPTRALELYGRVVSDDPENVAALTGRGLCYLDLSRFAPAAASFESALKLVPSDADALLGLAEAYRAQGRDADAIRCYERYLAEHPDGEEAAVARNAIAELRR